MKKIKGFSLKEETIELIETLSMKETETQSRIIENAVRYYAREKYGME